MKKVITTSKKLVSSLTLLFLIGVLNVSAQTCTGYKTFTQGGWGTSCNGGNPGCYRDANFASAFPNGLTIGCTNKITLTCSSAVDAFLPSGSTPRALDPGTLINPGSSYSNVLAGQLIAVQLAIGFDNYDANFASATGSLGSLVIATGPFTGMTVNAFVLEANRAIGGCPSVYSFSDLNTAATNINENFDAGSCNHNFLSCSSPLVISCSPAANVSCFGGQNGSATVNVSGGVQPYSYTWSNGAHTQSISGLSAGIYTITVTDAANHTSTSSVTITQPTAISISLTPHSTSCYAVTQGCGGSTNGSINSVVSGGTSPYTYHWSNNATTANITSAVAGSYTLTVTDAHGCTATATAVITQPTPIVVSISGSNVLCYGNSTGAATSTVSGGTGVYTYHWSNNATTANISSLSPGSYSLTVTDANGCTGSASATISQPTPMVVSLTPHSVSCFAVTQGCSGSNNGSITSSVSGGTSPYTYHWSNNATTSGLTSVTAGTYSVTVTDANGCTSTASATITTPTQILVTLTGANLTCNGNNSGMVSSFVTGGSGAYTYHWSNNATTSSISSLSAGSYSVTVTDANGCSASASTTITQPNALSISLTPHSVSCFAVTQGCGGSNNGSITSVVTGGTGALTYHWSNNATTANITNLTAGAYTLTITDANGCTSTASATITTPTQIIVTLTGANLTCNGNNSGMVSSFVTGGTGAYTYHWSNNATTSSITSLSAGTYSVTVTDGNGCSASASTSITQPSGISLTLTPHSVSCYAVTQGCSGSNNGSITSTVSGGTGSYTYLWSNNANTANVTNLTAGTYTLTVVDANGCSASASASVTTPTPIVVSLSSVNVACNGGSTGSLLSTVSGGSGVYTYNWSNNAASANISHVGAGTYTLTVTDANGCSASATGTITQPAALAVTLTPNMVSCHTSCSNSHAGTDGSVYSSVSGGTAPYTYLWNNNATSSSISSLIAGVYSVTITDANGCTITASATVSQPTPIAISFITNNVSCHGGSNGSIISIVTGGSGAFTYHWSNNATSANISGLIIGNYSLTVTDANGCSSSASANIFEPTAVTVSLSGTSASCNGGATGAITSTVAGGTPGYSYNWSNNATTANISSLTAGTYSLTVTDTKGCTAAASTTITEPTAVSVSLNASSLSCNGNSTGAVASTVTGGTGVYTYNWSNNATSASISSLAAGTYSVTVTDANGCSASATTTVTEPSVLTASVSHINVSCFGGNDGSVSTTVNGGTGVYTYLWSNTSISADLSSLVAATYSATITDANGCSATVSACVTQPTLLTATAVSTNATINGVANGTASVTPNGGTAPYSVNWSNGMTGASITGLAAGSYTATITDAHGCSTTVTVIITQPSPVNAIPTITNVSCNAGSNGAISLAISGGVAPYTVAWSNGMTGASITGLVAGSYTAVITDANGGTYTLTSAVTEPTAIVVSLTGTNLTCHGNSTGAVSSTVSGGSSNFTYNWSNGANTANISGLAAGTYTLTVTDCHQCSATASVTIFEPSALVVTLTSTDAACNGGANGTVTSTVSGGTTNEGAYSYSWSNSSSTSNLTGLTAGTYTVTVTDANGCSATATVTVNQPTPIVVSLTGTNLTCNGNSTGAASSTVSGGSNNYSYSWSNGANTANISGVAAGTYTLTVTDCHQCSATASVTITQPAAVAVSLTASNVVCNSGNNGSIASTVTGGTGAYSYHWNNNATTSSLSSLTAGTYSVSVTDANGCSASASATVTQPNPMSVVVSANGATTFCAGGSVTLTATGATTYLWSNGATTASISVNASGTYSVVGTNAVGCTSASNSVTVHVVALPTITISANGPTTFCAGGSVTLTATGGASYLWSNGATGSSITVSASGTYSVMGTCNFGCNNASNSITVTVNPLPVVTATSSSSSVCGGNNVTLTGGGAATYTWTGGVVNGVAFIPTASATYTVTGTNANGCSSSATATVNVYGGFTIGLTSVNVSCNGGTNGSATVSVAGCTSGYTIHWSNGATTATASGLTAGSYTVTVTDSHGCSVTGTVNISQPTAIVITLTATNASCTCGNSGAISSTVSGGSGSFTYHWSNNATTANISALTAGTYTLTVTDCHGCSASATATVTAPTPIAVSLSATNVSCNGSANGAITSTVTGGNGAYTYHWSNNATTANLTGVTAGTYTLTVTSSNGCTASASVCVTQPTALVVSLTATNATCTCGTSGSVSSSVSGGTAPYTYHWSNNAATANLSTIGAGTYTLTVTDAHGCTASATATVSAPTPVVVTLNATNLSCSCGATGAITSVVSGGNGTYTYHWSNNATTANVSGLAAGTYTLTVTSGNGCTATATATISAPVAIVISLTPHNISACGCGTSGSITSAVSGGTSPYTYHWSNNASTSAISSLSAGTYTLTVTDAHGCTASASASISQAAPLALSVTSVNASIIGGTGTATANVTGGTAPYTYHWNSNPVQTTQTANLLVGTWTIVVTDANGCTRSACVTITLTSGCHRNTMINNGGDENNAPEARIVTFPNPMIGDNATIEYTFPTDTKVNVEVYNIAGQLMDAVYAGDASANEKYDVNFNAEKLNAGTYFIRITTDSNVYNNKVMVTK